MLINLQTQLYQVIWEKIIKLINIGMYRGTPYLNRNIKRRQEQKSMQYHMNNLNHIRPRTGTIDSNSGEVQINNKKREMQKQARFTEIERENRILLEKISSIMGKQNRRTESQNRINRSLNSQFRKRQMQNIEIENAKLLRRLQQKRPNYETQKFKQSWRKQKQVIKNLSNYPFVIKDKARKRQSVSQIGGRDSKSNVIQLCRMRIIDGVSFLVTIRLSQQKLQIIGDTKDKKELKVIQIQRKEAIQFVEQQCKGKIQNIFNCLRYDKVDEVLYLVANDVQIEDMKTQSPSAIKQRKREENPQFDISVQNQDEEKDNIPIHVTNGTENKQYWVEVDRKKTQKFNANNDQEFKKDQDHHQQQENGYEDFQEQNASNMINSAQQKQQNKNRLQQGINTYDKIKKTTEQSKPRKSQNSQIFEEEKRSQNKIIPKSEASQIFQKSSKKEQHPLAAQNKSRQVSQSYDYNEFQETNKKADQKSQHNNEEIQNDSKHGEQIQHENEPTQQKIMAKKQQSKEDQQQKYQQEQDLGVEEEEKAQV